jgi:N6-adenosine-specific RNA methylase IME4
MSTESLVARARKGVENDCDPTLEIDDEFRRLIPPCTIEEYELLEASIVQDGCREPLVVWNNVILDGHNRYAICTKHDIPFKTVRKQFGNREAAKQWIILNQLGRRNLAAFQRGILGLTLWKAISDKARKQRGIRVDLSPNLAESYTAIDTREQVAKLVGLSHGTIDKIRLILEKATEQEKAELSSPNPKLTIQQVYRRIRQDEMKTKTPTLPGRKFSVLYIDPPWKFEFVRSRSRDVANHYPTMTWDELSALEISSIAENDAVMFMWAPGCKLQEALDLIKKWGFTYRSCAVWVKDKIGQGQYFRNQHELLLVAVRGNPPTPQPRDRTSSVIEAQRRRHSEKPENVYAIIETMYPNSSKIELFARTTRPNWASWGNEVLETTTVLRG